MALLAFLLSIVSIISTSHAIPLQSSPGHCYWPDPEHGNYHDCTPQSATQDIQGATLSIFTFNSWEAAPPLDSTWLSDTNQAATDALNVYGKLQSLDTLNINVFGVSDLKDVNAWSTFDSSTTTCSIRITTQNPKDQAVARLPIQFKQTLAHELYHCVQYFLGQGPFHDIEHDLAAWWMEGTAAYFAHMIYPKASLGFLVQYHPTIPLYLSGVTKDADGQLRSSGQTVAILFQHLASNLKWSSMDIHNFMLKQTPANSIEEEFSRISLETNLADAFPAFATHFLDQRITDVEGTTIESMFVSATNFKELALTGGPEVYTLPLQVEAWNIATARKATFQPNQLITVEFMEEGDQDDRTVLQYRQSSDTEWKVLHTGEIATLQEANTMSCPATITEFFFLFTSTSHPASGKPSSEVTLEVTITEPETKGKRQASCQQPSPPTNVTHGTTDQCLIGNWALEISSMQAILAQAFSAQGSGATISNLVVSGAASFNVTSTFSSSMIFNNLLIAYDGSASGFAFHTDIDIDGSVTGNLVDVGNSTAASFTWAHAVSTGTADTNTTISGLGDSIPLDVDLNGQYGNETTVQYVCKDTSLELTGYVAGKYAWAYTWIKS